MAPARACPRAMPSSISRPGVTHGSTTSCWSGSAVGHSPTGRADLSLRANGNIDIAGSLDLLANAISSNGGGRADANALVQAGDRGWQRRCDRGGPAPPRRLGCAAGRQRQSPDQRHRRSRHRCRCATRGDVTYGSLAVTANALNNGTHAAYARALADLAAGRESGDIAGGAIRILASAHDLRGVRATADAGANLVLIASGGDIDIGSASMPPPGPMSRPMRSATARGSPVQRRRPISRPGMSSSPAMPRSWPTPPVMAATISRRTPCSTSPAARTAICPRS